MIDYENQSEEQLWSTLAEYISVAKEIKQELDRRHSHERLTMRRRYQKSEIAGRKQDGRYKI